MYRMYHYAEWERNPPLSPSRNRMIAACINDSRARRYRVEYRKESKKKRKRDIVRSCRVKKKRKDGRWSTHESHVFLPEPCNEDVEERHAAMKFDQRFNACAREGWRLANSRIGEARTIFVRSDGSLFVPGKLPIT